MASSYGKKSSVLQTFAARVVYKSWMRLGVFVVHQIMLYQLLPRSSFPIFNYSLFVICVF